MGKAIPQLWVIAGPNRAGKTTLVARRIQSRISVVNPDTIAQELPLVDGRLDERRAGTIASQRRDALLNAGESFAIETTLLGSSTLNLMRSARLVRCGIARDRLIFQTRPSED